MGALQNAVQIGSADDFKNRVLAAMIYNARMIVVNNNASDRDRGLASGVLTDRVAFQNRFAWIIAADPEIAGATGNSTQISDEIIITKVQEAWPYIAGLVYA